MLGALQTVQRFVRTTTTAAGPPPHLALLSDAKAPALCSRVYRRSELCDRVQRRTRSVVGSLRNDIVGVGVRLRTSNTKLAGRLRSKTHPKVSMPLCVDPVNAGCEQNID